MVRWTLALVLTAAVIPIQSDIPIPLAAMAQTEREFAKAATVVGWRDAFLEYFADDAIAFSPGVVPAKDGLRKQPSTPSSIAELVWEPRTGDVAASGDIGWLTGPSTSINRKGAEPVTRHGCYLSVWRKQPGGQWRVFIDVGANSPEPVPFAPGFTRTTIPKPYRGSDGQAAATASLVEADRTLNTDVGSWGFARAFETRLASGARLHRPGSIPQTGQEAIVRWLGLHATTGTAKDVGVEAASSGDFGYTHGSFEVKEPKPLTGVYIRLWNRDASGRWWLMVDVAQVFKS
jgi:ketosteroid isomerase-like protein